MESFFLNRNFNLFSVLSLNILFFFKLIFTIFSWFNFYWVIPLSWSRSQGFTILIFRSFLFVDFFLISYFCNWFVENKTLCFFFHLFFIGLSRLYYSTYRFIILTRVVLVCFFFVISFTQFLHLIFNWLRIELHCFFIFRKRFFFSMLSWSFFYLVYLLSLPNFYHLIKIK
jgi:hypothetical protein